MFFKNHLRVRGDTFGDERVGHFVVCLAEEGTRNESGIQFAACFRELLGHADV